MPSKTVSNLLPNTSYDFWVYATNLAGDGQQSDQFVVTTTSTTENRDFSNQFSVAFA